jgi:hypothetical protein
MIRTYFLFVLIASTLEVTIMASQGSENDWESKLRPFKEFVIGCKDGELTERLKKYSTKIDALIKEGKTRNMLKMDNGLYGLMEEIARQGDFECLDLIEKNLPQDLKMAVWLGVRTNVTDDSKKMLVKWAMENPAVSALMDYHPNAVKLLIERAEDKKAAGEERVMCLRMLARMPEAASVLDRIKALMSDHSGFVNIGVQFLPGKPPETVGSIAAETVKQLEASIQKQEK